ncbi:MAG: response regulator [Pseudomonadota bacterium]
MPHVQRILIVEDEPLIAMMLEDFLDVLDRHCAGTVDSVAAAIARIDEGGVDGAILDVNLRGGEQSWPIADRLAQDGIPFILATGGSGEVIVPAHRARPALSKPFTIDGIEAALASLG